MRSKLILLLFAVVALLSACDDGRIYSTTTSTREGLVVVLTGSIEGMDNWPSKYTIALAGFDEETASVGEYAEITKAIIADDDGTLNITLNGISSDVQLIELCLLDRLRRRVATFASIEADTYADTLYFEVGHQDVSMINTIQQTIFSTTCANCHGASTSAAAGLYLTEGLSYSSLVGQESTKEEGLLIVDPYSSESSVLYQVLTTDLSSSWLYNHSSEVTTSALLTLVADWIDNGAPED